MLNLSLIVYINDHKYFEAKSKRKSPLYSWDKVNLRTCHALGISKSLLHSCLKNNDLTSDSGGADVKNLGTDSFDSFSKDLIKREVLTLISKNENITLGKLKQHLKEKNDLCVGKYKLWKTLHQLGFRYRKLTGNRRVLTEKHDIINKRINFLRKIRSRREEGSTIVYLDETWIDSNQYPPYQWVPPNPEQQKKLPLNKGQRLYCVVNAFLSNNIVDIVFIRYILKSVWSSFSQS